MTPCPELSYSVSISPALAAMHRRGMKKAAPVEHRNG
nr:MAG TPA: hypothetical protein [Caudoviricetes sp.]